MFLKVIVHVVNVHFNIETMTEKYELSSAPGAVQLFGNAGRDYMRTYSKSFKEKIKNQISSFVFFNRCFT